MTNQSGNLPGTTAPQAQLARLRKRLTSLSTQLDRLSDKADASNDEQLKKLLSRARANTTTALSLSDAVETIASQTALDLLVTPNNNVHVSVAVTAFEDVPDINELKPLATAMAPVVLQDESSAGSEDNSLGLQTPKRFSCCSPDPQKWFPEDNAESKHKNDHAATSGGANTCEQPSYMMLTLPVSINSSKERIDEFLKLGDSLVATAQGQLGQAREAICHSSGEETCSLF
jgi:hypothetical protein